VTNRACGGSPQHSALVGAVKRERAAGGRSLVPVICSTFPGRGMSRLSSTATGIQAFSLSEAKTKVPALQVFHGASRTRTGDLLDAISAKGVATNRNSLQFGRFMRVSGPCASASIAIFRDRRLTKT
jgi:hypothetical protein